MKTDKIRQTKKALIDALTKTLGIVTPACEIVGVCRDTFYRYVNQDEKFAKDVKDIEEIAFDYVESRIFKQIREDNTAMIIFYAKTKMKRRGYIERYEITGKDGNVLIPITAIKIITNEGANDRGNGSISKTVCIKSENPKIGGGE